MDPIQALIEEAMTAPEREAQRDYASALLMIGKAEDRLEKEFWKAKAILADARHHIKVRETQRQDEVHKRMLPGNYRVNRNRAGKVTSMKKVTRMKKVLDADGKFHGMWKRTNR